MKQNELSIGDKIYYFSRKFPYYEISSFTISDMMYHFYETDSENKYIYSFSTYQDLLYDCKINQDNETTIYPTWDWYGEVKIFSFNYSRGDYIASYDLKLLQQEQKEWVKSKLKQLEEQVNKCKEILKEK